MKVQRYISVFEETLAELIEKAKENCKIQNELIQSVELEIENSQAILDGITRQYEELISGADIYDTANFESKKDDC